MGRHSEHHCNCSHKKDLKVNNLKVCNDLTLKGQFNQIHKTHKLSKCDVKRRSKNGNPDERYDVIVVGAGTSGSLLTYRLAEHYGDKVKVLVLDVGQDDVRITTGFPDNPGSVVPNPNPGNGKPVGDGLGPDAWGQLLRGIAVLFGEGCAQWQDKIETNPNDALLRVPIQYARGATLGGCSAINGNGWNRGTKTGTYDRWEEATGDVNFGFTEMVGAYKKIENRTQSVKIFGDEQRIWEVDASQPGQELNGLMGTDGKMFLTSRFQEGYDTRAIDEALLESPLPGRDDVIPVRLADVSLTNPEEFGYFIPFTEYSQSDSNFPTFNPYDPANSGVPMPGTTYTPQANSGNTKGPEFAGSGPKDSDARCYAAPAYLYPILDNKIPHTVTIKQRTYVTKLIVNNNEVIGVEYVEGENGEAWQVAEVNRAIDRDVAPYKGTESGIPQVIANRDLCSFDAAVKNQENVQTFNAFAKTDIWLCAGVIDSPAIMQRSGIGPRELLESLRIQPVECKVDLQGVGKGAQDTLNSTFMCQFEGDYSIDRPGLPAGINSLFYSNIFGYADPDNNSPFSQIFTASIFGDYRPGVGLYKLKSNSSLDYSDYDLVFSGISLQLAGNLLYQDLEEVAGGLPLNVDNAKIKPVFDRARWGFYPPIPSGDYLQQNTIGFEYWNQISQGVVQINSGNVFERPTYSPGLLENENDIEAVANIFTNSIFPIVKRMGSKRFGPRGVATYRGNAQSGGTDFIVLSSNLGAVKPIIGNIDQVKYDKAGSLDDYILDILAGPGFGQRIAIKSWSGAGGGYVATFESQFMPVGSGSVYALNPPGSTPTDSVEFGDDNHRNFVRFAHPNGDELFSPVVNSPYLGDDPLDTTQNSTRVRVNHPNSGFEDGDMIKIIGVQGPVNGIDEKFINDYHLVYNVDAQGYDIILFWNLTPTGGPGSSADPSPSENATTGSGGGNTVTVQTLRFDEAKFRTWLKTHYFTGWHGCCSCRMGKADDTTAVVDTRARVYDVKGLRVCDASIFPVKPNCNSMAPTYGIAQKLFDLVSVEEYDHLL